MGTIYQRGNVYWIQYYNRGKQLRESAKSGQKRTAQRLLAAREAAIEQGRPLPDLTLTVEALCLELLREYRMSGRRDVDNLENRLHKHVLPAFERLKASALTTADCRQYIEARQQAGAANATINREMAGLRRAYSLAVHDGRLAGAPYIPMLKEDNVRTGFFEAEQFEAMCRHLPDYLQPPLRFAYLTGWRVPSEVLRLQWRHVDWPGGVVTLDATMTKNATGRSFPLTDDLRTLLTAQRAATTAIERERQQIIPHVFHREGKPIGDYRKAWYAACALAGCPGRIPHDLRRTAVRNLVRVGIPERVAMQMTGHKTRSVFERYNIVSPGDLTAAAARLNGGRPLGAEAEGR